MSNEGQVAPDQVDVPAADDEGKEALSREALRVEIERLQERNDRLQQDYSRARQAEHRRTAVGLAVVGLVALAGAGFLPALREVLVVLGAGGLFGAVLVFYLAPEQFVAAEVTRDVYSAMNRDRVALASELNLSNHQVYVPLSESGSPVRLFIPQYDDFAVPDSEELDLPLVVPSDEKARGVTFTPTGRYLYESFVETVSGTADSGPETLATQLGEALSEQFALVDRITVSGGDGKLTVALGDNMYGPPGKLDHPVASVVGVGVARAVGRPVETDAERVQQGRFDYLVTYRWGEQSADAEAEAEDGTEAQTEDGAETATESETWVEAETRTEPEKRDE